MVVKHIFNSLLAPILYRGIALGFPGRSHLAEKATRFLSYYRLAEAIGQYRINLIVDVGANRGQFASLLRKVGYSGWIVSFEPNPDDFSILCAKREGDSRWKGYRYALGASKEAKNFNIGNISELSSFHELSGTDANLQRTILVEVETLDGLKHEILKGIADPRIMVKIDTQGYDAEVIKGGREFLEGCVLLQTEVAVKHLYSGTPHFTESIRHLEGLGFSVLELLPVTKSPTTLEMVEFDCLLAKSSEVARLHACR